MESDGIESDAKYRNNRCLVVWMCIVLSFCTVTAAPIKQRSAFSVVNELSTQKFAQQLFVGDFNGNKQMDFGIRSKSTLAVERKNSLGFWIRKQFLFHAPTSAVTVADFNNDGFDDIAALEPQPLMIEIFWGTLRDSLSSTLVFHSDAAFDNLFIELSEAALGGCCRMTTN